MSRAVAPAQGGSAVPKTLFVVDDSATMRKVFEMTFAGEDVTVVTHDGGDSVMGRAREAHPALVIVDANLDGRSGYELCRSIKADGALRGVPVMLLYSDHSPLDDAKARECGADGTLAKPFETQVAIDKIKSGFTMGGAAPSPSAAAAPPAAPAPAAFPPRPAEPGPPTAPRATAAVGAQSTPKPIIAPPPPPAEPTRPPSSAGVGAVGSSNAPGASHRTQVFVPPSSIAAPNVGSAGPRHADSGSIEMTIEPDDEMSVDHGTLAELAQKSGTMSDGAPSAASALSSDVAKRVAAMGLSPAQVDAVTALTRDVVERVVWEVVPQLAETLLREEIRRLTAE